MPKHGYRFVAEIKADEGQSVPTPRSSGPDHSQHAAIRMLLRAILGGAAAGIIGGVVYGMIGLADAPSALSSLLVLVVLCGGVGLLAGVGVGAGLALADRFASGSRLWLAVGGALGGAIVGALAKLLGSDAFNLLLGAAPDTMTGAPEGLIIGLAIGLALLVPGQTPDGRTSPAPVAVAGALGVVSGALIAFSGGCLMAGSLAALAEAFGGSKVGLERIAALFGEADFGPLSLAFTTAFEAMLFATMVVAAIRFRTARHDRPVRPVDAARVPGSV